VHPTKSQEKWQIRLEKEIVKEDWHIIYSIPTPSIQIACDITKSILHFVYKQCAT
jgi:hypothetical protein